MKRWSFEEMCLKFQAIEKNPFAPSPFLTVGDYLQAQIHISLCKDCSALRDRVLARQPEENDSKINFN